MFKDASEGEISKLQTERRKTVESREMLTRMIQYLERVATDDRMRECFNLLDSEFAEDAQYENTRERFDRVCLSEA